MKKLVLSEGAKGRNENASNASVKTKALMRKTST